MEIHWDRWFDKVYCLWYVPNKARLPRLEKECRRIDLWECPLFELRKMVPQRMESIVLEWSRKQQGGSNYIVAVGNGMENIRVMRESLLMGYERIMVIEDDATFLKDKATIVETLDAMPDNFGMIQMDKAVHNNEELSTWNTLLASKRINDYFVDGSGTSFTLATCNVYTRNGLEKMLEVMETRMACIDVATRYIDTEPAIAIKNLCIQQAYGDMPNKAHKERAMQRIYELEGISFGEYAIQEQMKEHTTS